MAASIGVYGDGLAVEANALTGAVSASAHAGIKNGTRRYLGHPEFGSHQQDRHVAFAASEMPDGDKPVDQLTNMLDQLGEKHADADSSAAASLVRVSTEDGPNGRSLKLEASSIGDCDVFVAVTPGDGGPTRVQRLFDDECFPAEFGRETPALRKLVNGIGLDVLPETMSQTVKFDLQPGDTATVITASDGYWDGYCDACKFIDQGMEVEDANRAIRELIGESIDRGLADPSSPMADRLVDDIIERAEAAARRNTDNISTTALVIEGDKPAPSPIVIGSIDGSGKVGPTEEMVDSMVADIHERFGPSIVAANDSQLNTEAASRLGSWRADRAPKGPTTGPEPKALKR
ncbi:MAG: hypothetical protein KI792_05130 [Alphaproteobacteria bacterium]|nr:hypothetical protein [Alphaproteobacteria bacterium SS10]